VVDQSKENISNCKGLRDVAMATKFSPKYVKMAITSVVSDTICIETGFVPLGNSSVILPYTRDIGALPWRPILG